MANVCYLRDGKLLLRAVVDGKINREMARKQSEQARGGIHQRFLLCRKFICPNGFGQSRLEV